MDLNRFNNWWVAIQVRPRYEFITAKVLRGKGYEEFVPSYTTKRQWSDRRKLLELPLFTGYVFCKLTTEICWPIVTTPGVIRIVGTGGDIGRIEDAEIEAIQKLAKAKMKLEPCPYLAIGQRVRVTDGPLTGAEGILTAYKNRRLILSVTVVQSSIAVEIDGYSVEPAGPAAGTLHDFVAGNTPGRVQQPQSYIS
jgi:transcriptional antiterminator RfaH